MPILKKMGFRDGMKGLVLDMPEAQTQAFSKATEATSGAPIWILAWVKDIASLNARADALLATYVDGGYLWLAYPKQSGAIKTDISRDRGWDALTKHDLLPVSIAAIDKDWSALRFRFRHEIKTLTRKF